MKHMGGAGAASTHAVVSLARPPFFRGDTMPRCRQCEDELPEDCPADVTSCRSYCRWKARLVGDMLTEEQARDLELFAGLCELDVACRDGLELLPELD